MTPPVTEREARAHLAKLADAARARDFDRLCALNGSVLNCRRTLAIPDVTESTPSAEPTVVGTWYVPEKGDQVAGRVLVVAGTTSCGQPYRTEVFVFRENRFGFKAINGVFWSNFSFDTGPVLKPPGGAPPPRCP